MGRENRRDAGHKYNSFENYRVSYRALCRTGMFGKWSNSVVYNNQRNEAREILLVCRLSFISCENLPASSMAISIRSPKLLSLQ